MRKKMIRDWDATVARKMLLEGSSYTRVASYFGTTTTTVHCWLDPEYAAHYRNNVNERRRGRSVNAKPSRHTTSYSQPAEADFAARLAEIPPDKRTFTQRMFGDPVFERSALYRKQSNAS